ncbi:MAG: NUDIX hydrolase [Candidatus Woesebacteria bacterium]|nr:NUDIX hydrolase [Candidatus Woesebacteria bacterium]
MTNLDLYTNYKTVLSVNALIFSEGKLLLLKRAADKKVDPNMYAGIGGKVEPHEDFYSALLREIEEETGLTEFKSIKLYSVTQHPYPPSDSEWVNLYFLVTIDKQIEIPKSNDGEFFWIDPKDTRDLPMPTDLKKYIKIIKDNPEAMILGYFDHDQDGKIIEEKIKII